MLRTVYGNESKLIVVFEMRYVHYQTDTKMNLAEIVRHCIYTSYCIYRTLDVW